jgi:hypothetical protein
MARSIASSGLSTTLPWPGASLAGSRARNARALSSSIGRCQEKSASGQRGYTLAEVATPPSVE